MSFPAWNDGPDPSSAYADNVPSWPPTQPTDPLAGTIPGTMKVYVKTWKISLKSDIDQYLIPSLTSPGIPSMLTPGTPFEDPLSYYPITWGTEARRGWFLPMPNLPSPPGQDWAMNVSCKMLLQMMMAHGVGAPGYWSYDPNAQMTAGMVWIFV